MLDKLYIKKSKFINDLLRMALFGEGDIMNFLKFLWWARGDSNPGPSPCEGDVITSLDHGPALKDIHISSDFAYKFFWLFWNFSTRFF